MVQAGTTDRITPLLHHYYVSRLRSDLSRWVEQGWVRREDMDAILKDAASSDQTSGSLPNLLALLGAVLVAAGALLFLAANWEGMGRVAKLAVLAAALWGAHAASYAAVRAKADQFAEAMLLLSVALFGAGIMLIGQIYPCPPILPPVSCSGRWAPSWLPGRGRASWRPARRWC
jgi:uncharacterized membrane protein